MGALPQPGGWHERGRLRVLTGAAAGLIGMIRTDRGVRTDRAEDGRRVELWQALGAEVVPGDRVRLEAGCDKRAETCRAKFSNLARFRGFPHVPRRRLADRLSQGLGRQRRREPRAMSADGTCAMTAEGMRATGADGMGAMGVEATAATSVVGAVGRSAEGSRATGPEGPRAMGADGIRAVSRPARACATGADGTRARGADGACAAGGMPVVDRPDVVAAARAWVGTPYMHQASVKGVGTDCLGLLRGVWREVQGAEPEAVPAYTRDWSEPSGEEALWTVALRHLAPGTGAEGEVLLFRMRDGSVAKHVGIAASLGGSPSVIHAYSGHSVVESPLSAPWARRVVARFAFPAAPAGPSS